MTHPYLTRVHLEAVLIATVGARRDLADSILASVDQQRLSPAAWALLVQLTDTVEAKRARGEFLPNDSIRTHTKAQVALADRVEAVTFGEMCFHPLDTLIALVNQLPLPTPRQQAWERDLAIALDNENAA